MQIEIPLANPLASYHNQRREFDRAISTVLESNRYILGEAVEKLEQQFAARHGCAFGIGVASGTDALSLAMMAMGVQRGDEVITSAHTSVATVSAIDRLGAVAVLVDIDPECMTIDPGAIADSVNEKTKAVVPVHIYGQPAKMSSLKRICDDRGLLLIEDCAQAHGAMWNQKPVGSFGNAGCFSFYPTKNLGAFGDGGMVVTDSETLSDRVRKARQYGWDIPHHAKIAGWNSRLDEIQAAVLLVKLGYLETGNARRRHLAETYHLGLSDLPIDLPIVRDGNEHVFHLYAIRLKNQEIRDGLKNWLSARGIATGIHYPYPIHHQPGYREKVKWTSLQHSEDLSRRVLSLPMFPELSDAQQRYVMECIVEFFEARRS